VIRDRKKFIWCVERVSASSPACVCHFCRTRSNASCNALRGASYLPVL